ncbi:MAG: MMPL family transporter [Candidatus Dormibacteria bacterium]
MLFRHLGELGHRFRYAIIAAWVLGAVALNVAIPQLSDVIKRDATPFLPNNSDVMRAYDTMGQKFGGRAAGGDVIVVLENTRGLTPADYDFYATLVKRLGGRKDRVPFMTDYISHPEFKDAAVSRDRKAIYLFAGLKTPVGTPGGDSDAFWVRDQVKADRPNDLRAYVTGDSAIIADYQRSIDDSTKRTTVITLVLLLVILLLIYRSPVTPLIPLGTIVLAIAVVRPVVALLGLHYIKVASFTETFILAIVFGAGTDYCMFMISRFKEQRAQGDPAVNALATTTRRVGEAIASSAATVIVGGLAMSGANVSLFSTTGPAIAVAVAVTLVAGLTLTPALIAVGGDRFFWPQRVQLDHPGRFWTRASGLIVSRPRRVLVASLVPLLLLAALYPTMKLTYDERSPQPQGNENITGLKALDRHYPAGEILPDYVLIRADHDIRNPRDLAALDSATRALARVDGVASVRSFTQPQGDRVAQASIPYQVGQVGAGLAQGSQKIEDGSAGLQQLQQGGQQLSAGGTQLAAGAHQAAGATDKFIAGLEQENTGLGQAIAGTGTAQAGSLQLRDGARQLASGLHAAHQQMQPAVNGLGQIYTALSLDPICQNTDPVCQQSTVHIHEIWMAERDGLMPGLQRAADAADQIAAGNGSLGDGLGTLRAGLSQAQAGIVQLEEGEKTFKARLAELAGGADKLGAGAGQLGGGVSQLAGGTAQLKAGLDQAAGFLNSVSQDAQGPGLDTFYVPAAHLNDQQLALARFYYISSDGTTARLLVLGKDDPFGVVAMDRAGREQAAVRSALHGTPLAGAQVLEAGFAAQNANLRDYFSRDFRVVALAVLIGVLVVLILLLRSLVAPFYLLGSVLLSYGGAMGITTLLWQDLLHKGAIDWTVPIFAFVMLVAVGADYNIFLMSRVREEVMKDPVNGIGRAIQRTGAIITSAGIIFAGTFAALVTSPVINIAETGFAITVGLLLDTFIVRSFVVPAIAVLLGKWNWWPHFGVKPSVGHALEETGGPDEGREIRRSGGPTRLQPAK